MGAYVGKTHEAAYLPPLPTQGKHTSLTYFSPMYFPPMCDEAHPV